MDNIFLNSFINELEKQAGIKFLTKKIKKPDFPKFFRKIIGIPEGPEIKKIVRKEVVPELEKTVDKIINSIVKSKKPEVIKSLKKAILPIIGVSAASGTAAGAGFYGMKKLLNSQKNEQDFLAKLY